MKTTTHSKNTYVFTLLAVFLLFLTVSQVSASNDHINQNAGKNGQENQEKNRSSHSDEGHQEIEDHKPATPTPSVSVSTDVTGTVTPTPTGILDNDCDDAKNHGQFVSCVAHRYEGGKVTSEAARSDTGKKHREDNDEDDITPSISPSVSPTGTITPTPTEDPNATSSPSLTATPSPSITTSPSATPTGEPTAQGVGASVEEIKFLIKELNGLIHSLLSSFHA